MKEKRGEIQVHKRLSFIAYTKNEENDKRGMLDIQMIPAQTLFGK